MPMQSNIIIAININIKSRLVLTRKCLKDISSKMIWSCMKINSNLWNFQISSRWVAKMYTYLKSIRRAHNTLITTFSPNLISISKAIRVNYRKASTYSTPVEDLAPEVTEVNFKTINLWISNSQITPLSSMTLIHKCSRISSSSNSIDTLNHPNRETSKRSHHRQNKRNRRNPVCLNRIKTTMSIALHLFSLQAIIKKTFWIRAVIWSTWTWRRAQSIWISTMMQAFITHRSTSIRNLDIIRKDRKACKLTRISSMITWTQAKSVASATLFIQLSDRATTKTTLQAFRHRRYTIRINQWISLTTAQLYKMGIWIICKHNNTVKLVES